MCRDFRKRISTVVVLCDHQHHFSARRTARWSVARIARLEHGFDGSRIAR